MVLACAGDGKFSAVSPQLRGNAGAFAAWDNLNGFFFFFLKGDWKVCRREVLIKKREIFGGDCGLECGKTAEKCAKLLEFTILV